MVERLMRTRSGGRRIERAPFVTAGSTIITASIGGIAGWTWAEEMVTVGVTGIDGKREGTTIPVYGMVEVSGGSV